MRSVHLLWLAGLSVVGHLPAGCSSDIHKWDVGIRWDGTHLPPDSGPRWDSVARPRLEAGANQESGAGPCAAGETPFGGHCYRMAGIMGITYTTAKDLCANQSPPMQPAAITSADENKFIFDSLPAYNQVSWLGLRRTGAGSQDFAWESGEAPTYWNWAPGEPNNENGQEDCAVIWGPALGKADLRSFWNDSPCNHDLVDNIVCERQP